MIAAWVNAGYVVRAYVAACVPQDFPVAVVRKTRPWLFQQLPAAYTGVGDFVTVGSASSAVVQPLMLSAADRMAPNGILDATAPRAAEGPVPEAPPRTSASTPAAISSCVTVVDVAASLPSSRTSTARGDPTGRPASLSAVSPFREPTRTPQLWLISHGTMLIPSADVTPAGSGPVAVVSGQGAPKVTGVALASKHVLTGLPLSPIAKLGATT